MQKIWPQMHKFDNCKQYIPNKLKKWGYKIFMLMNDHEIVYNYDIYCGKVLYVLKSNNNISLHWQTFKSDLNVFRIGNSQYDGGKHLQFVGTSSSISGVILEKIWPHMHKLDNRKQYLPKRPKKWGYKIFMLMNDHEIVLHNFDIN